MPDWPVVAAATLEGVPADVPTAVHDGRRLVTVSAGARAEGVRRGMQRRQAQGLCPALVLLDADEPRDVRMFEPVAAAAETVVSGVEVVRAGLLLLPAGGASRYHGSEDRLAELLVSAVAERTGHECAVGTADGLLAAVLAARTGEVVPPGTSPAFLAGRPMADLVHAAVTDEDAAEVLELVDLLHRLGLRHLGRLAALPPAAVHARFGRRGTWAQTLARGEDERPPVRRRPEADVEAATALDPPLDRVDQATFAGRRLAEELHAALVARALTCGRLRIDARTEAGEELSRTWRTDMGGWGGLTPARITDRIRWQLEGWLASAAAEAGRAARAARARADREAGRTTGRTSGRSSGLRTPGADGVDADGPDAPPALDVDTPGVTLVHLAVTALDVAPVGAEQGRLWGGPSGGDLRAHRALDRVQGIVGVDGVLLASLQGGRDVRDQVHLRAWGEQEAAPRPVDRPWPGRLPDPAPACVLAEPVPVEVLDAHGRPVRVDPRQSLSGDPAVLRWTGDGARGDDRGGARGDDRGGARGDDRGSDGGGGSRRVVGWAGPWLVLERWWVLGAAGQVRAHLQVALDDRRALLLTGTAEGWTCEATYD
ncbi:DNA polymerase Y family protein [Cellulomonas marina]|uniref:DNA polymerase Y family protein n=1 Tax=Cellulomonas marina TaxID=988821 RepID=UPI001EF2400A|nr:DNA polymerase Y family protein [Cellulomonas marina]